MYNCMMYVQLSRVNDTSRIMDFLVLILFSFVIASNDVIAGRLPYGLRYKDRRTIDISSMRLLKDVYEASDDKNVVTSPLGIFVLLSLYSTVTNGTSRQEIQNYLGFQDYRQLTHSYEFLSESLSSMDPTLLTFANKVCISDKYQLENEFVTLATRRYHSEVSPIDLQNPEAAANSVNQWANMKSGGNIKDPVSPMMFTPDTVALLLNVIYFQGKWKYPFGVDDTTEEAFRVSPTETIMKPTMRIEREFTYGHDNLLRATMIQLPYNETDFSMFIVVPDEIDGLPSLLDTLAEVGALRVFSKRNMTYRKVYLQMPKFEVKTKSNVKDILVKEGVRGIFDKYNTGVVKGEEVRVSEVFQQASITVDEAGTEAAAFTYFGLELRCLMEEDEPVVFFVDRPFVYAILHKDVVLFTGTYTH
ncbi:PREDICTED: antichymotrypsin-1-like [Papilio polytes]|uniref:antichymotrypsin-1-like n=1 Tax=Papilio polytes TaxID=76194 RepID=UPI000676312E|nr:PREDICTED: antichymotrypsin-1-like [Papilio polytes]